MKAGLGRLRFTRTLTARIRVDLCCSSLRHSRRTAGRAGGKQEQKAKSKKAKSKKQARGGRRASAGRAGDRRVQSGRRAGAKPAAGRTPPKHRDPVLASRAPPHFAPARAAAGLPQPRHGTLPDPGPEGGRAGEWAIGVLEGDLGRGSGVEAQTGQTTCGGRSQRGRAGLLRARKGNGPDTARSRVRLGPGPDSGFRICGGRRRGRW